MGLRLEAMVLAGGLGTRLRDEVPDLPKPMAPVAGRPFLEHVLDRLQDQCVTRIVLSVGYMSETIRGHFGSRYRNLDLVYACEEQPLGTGGAIAFALKQVRQERVLVVNGDTYLDMDYGGFFSNCTERHARLGIAVRRVAETGRYGRCDLEDGTITSFSEKGIPGAGYINAGVYCITQDIFANFQRPLRFSFEVDFVARYLEQLRPLGFPVEGIS